MIIIANLTLYPKIVLNYQEVGNIRQFAIKEMKYEKTNLKISAFFVWVYCTKLCSLNYI